MDTQTQELETGLLIESADVVVGLNSEEMPRNFRFLWVVERISLSLPLNHREAPCDVMSSVVQYYTVQVSKYVGCRVIFSCV